MPCWEVGNRLVSASEVPAVQASGTEFQHPCEHLGMMVFLALGKQRQGAPAGLLAGKSSQLVTFPGSVGDCLKRIHTNP